MPETLGKSAHKTCFVDANHAGKVVTWLLHTSVLIDLMNALIIWFSNKHNTVEICKFGSEFVAMRITRDLVVALHYKLRIFGIRLDRPSGVMCDDQGVANNKRLTKSTLGKKKIQ